MKLLNATLVILLICLSGCNRLLLREHICSSSDEWNMFGGSPQRKSFVSTRLLLPMSQEWEYNSSASFGPFGVAACGNVIFAGNLRGEVHLIDLLTGEKIGAKDFGEAIFSPPIYDAGIIYVPISGSDAGLIAYDLRSGSRRWENKIGRIENAVLLIDDKIIVSTVSNGIFAVNKNNGSINWRSHKMNTRSSSPACEGKTVIFGRDDGYVVALNIEDGNLLWKKDVGEMIVAGPVIKDGQAFIGTVDGKMISMSLSTGDIAWRSEALSGIYSSAAVSDSNVFIVTSSGDIVSLRMRDGEPSWRFKTGGVLSSAPVLAGDLLFVGSLDKKIYALNSVTGKPEWKHDTAGRIVSAPVVYKERIVLLCDDNLVIAFKQEGNN